jgi:glucosylceramidase
MKRIRTSISNQCFFQEDIDCIQEKKDSCHSSLSIEKNITYQTHQGFGGAFTESACYNLTRVNKNLQEEIMKAYFDQNGLDYNLGRISMNGCDFSLTGYQYILDYDDSLNSFSLEHDKKMILPTIHWASRIHKKDIEILVSPWSPCWWMKDNQSTIHGGHLLECYHDIWAKYYAKFLTELKKEKINVFGVTIQNEPAASQRWDSCLYSALEEAHFIKEHFVPALRQVGLSPKIYIWDHNRDIMIERAKPIYDSDAFDLVSGCAIHWYDNEPFENLEKLHDAYPTKEIISTESCIEGGVHLHQIQCGERYARNIIGDFNHYCSMFIDWNLVLDDCGGPNWVGNYCDAPIILFVNQEKCVYEPSYYYIGHFSKYIHPGAKRVKHTFDQTKLQGVTYVNPSGELVCVLLNQTDEDQEINIKGFHLDVVEKEIYLNVSKHSIITLTEEK